MSDLARMEDLPAAYRKALTEQNLVPLWPALRSLIPAGTPQPATRPTMWSYEGLKPLLLEAGRLTPIEKAERRVLALWNPGHPPDRLQATPAMYLGMQLLLPGEWAPAHRHTPNAVRMIVEGDGAYTTVEGEKLPMQRGDLILTPTGLWHEHGHDGREPVIWLDVLDIPIVVYLEASYHVNGPAQDPKAARGDVLHARGGLLPAPMFETRASAYPMLRYPWTEARAALVALADIGPAQGAGAEPPPDAVQIRYVNPATGGDAENILGFSALMLRPGQTLELPLRSPAAVFHVIEGGVDAHIGSTRFALAEADTCCAPGWTRVSLANRSAASPAFVFVADEAPLHRKLGLYEVRA